jgi:hypothetical protein
MAETIAARTGSALVLRNVAARRTRAVIVVDARRDWLRGFIDRIKFTYYGHFMPFLCRLYTANPVNSLAELWLRKIAVFTLELGRGPRKVAAP